MKASHVITLDPTVKQAQALLRACGCARYAWNWGLAEWQRQYLAGEKPNAFKVKLALNQHRKSDLPWAYESPKNAMEGAVRDLGRAFQNFFDSLSGKRKGPRMGYPQRKRRGQRDSFYVANDKFSVRGLTAKLPVIGNVKLREPLRFAGKVLGGRVSLRAGRWFLSVQVETEIRVPNVPVGTTLGVDLNMGNISTSDGEVIDTPRSHRAVSAQLRRANRMLHRRVRGSKNRAKAKLRLARIHARIAYIRKDFLDKITTRLCRENQTVVIEDLNIAGIARCRSLARSVLDGGFGMFRHMMEYKCARFGTKLVVALRWFPSSKRCSGCGAIKRDLSLSERLYCCDLCGLTIPRDTNAAMNLMQYPRLEGNWDTQVSKTTVESRPLLDSMPCRASQLVEAVTNQCSQMSTS